MILDSDIIIDFLRNEKKIVLKILKLKESEELKTTSINAFEILKGYFAISRKEESIFQFINSLSILDFNYESSETAAKIFDTLKKQGLAIDPLDLFIASIAIANNEILMTRNIKHFERIPNLKLEKM
jgi:tRNA(fMet)-specific endonuclease VapC